MNRDPAREQQISELNDKPAHVLPLAPVVDPDAPPQKDLSDLVVDPSAPASILM